MWGSLEDNRELRKVVLKGRGLDGRTKFERKHESRVCLSECFHALTLFLITFIA